MPGEQIKKELVIIDSLLRSRDFSSLMAAVIYAACEDEQKEFFNGSEEPAVVNKTSREEKIAINLAGFYAVECGVGLLCQQTNLNPVAWLQKIANKTNDSNSVLLLNRFANATWKAGQPFRSLDRITRYNFTGAGYLSAEDIEKDYNQVTAAATLLLKHMKHVEKSSLQEQMEQLKALLQDSEFAFIIAKFLDSSYYISQRQPAPLFITHSDDTLLIEKSAREQKIATNLAGFYALECGINYLVTTRGIIPSDILRSITDNSISEADKTLFLHLANATWKAGQPFRDLNNIKGQTFTPVYFLAKEDMEKIMIQIRTAAGKLLATMEEMENKK